MVNSCIIRVDEEKAVQWIKDHRGTDVGDTPIWVLISLGLKALREDDKA